MKKQNKTPEKELKIETSDIPAAEFKTMVIVMFSQWQIQKRDRTYKKYDRKREKEMKSIITEIKYKLEEINSRLD